MINLEGAVKAFAVFAAIGTALSGLTLVYQAVVKVGEERAESRRLEADFLALKRQAGEAIVKLNEQYAAELMASRQRRLADEVKDSEYAATIADLELALEEARETDECVDKPVPLERAERVRQLAEDAGRRTLPRRD